MKEPVGYSVTIDGQHCGNLFATEVEAVSAKNRLNRTHPGPVRAVVPLGEWSDSLDARRYRTLKPFLAVEPDGDGDGSWADLTLKDEDTGVESVEIVPAAGAESVNAFLDRLADDPSCRVGFKSRTETTNG